ncbi:MAG: helicase, partial [Oscillospiraceae bacterium]|nr:helicase [Oscillospiraceae bacterium]
MTVNTDVIRKIDDQIMRSNSIICRHISNLDFLGRGAVSQDILKHLRDLVEHAMYRIYACENNVICYNYDNIKSAITYVKRKGKLKFLWRFHDYLLIVASHYSLSPEDSERVMLKYYEFMLQVKAYLKAEFNIDVLENISNFPLNTDKNLQEYYEKIAQKLTAITYYNSAKSNRYYIHKIKPFFVNQQIFYEVTFFPTQGKENKFERIIAFTTLNISKYYAVKLWTVEDTVTILEKEMPIHIIVNWEVAIRPVEIERFSDVFGQNLSQYAKSSEGRGLMHFLTETGYNLVELIRFEEDFYQQIRQNILTRFNAKTSHLFDIFDRCREIINGNLPGNNILRYLLYHMNKRVISDQIDNKNTKLSDLYLSYGCIPFDKMPFCTHPCNHKTRLTDLFDCIDTTDRNHEILARYILINTKQRGQLYTPKAELENFGDIDTLAKIFNGKLYYKHPLRRIETRSQHYFIREHEEDTKVIIKKLVGLSGAETGVENYTAYADSWLNSDTTHVDCEEKKKALRVMFSNSSVAVIYGSAGTGKSTLINHISNLFRDASRLYLANTNPAVDNMKR